MPEAWRTALGTQLLQRKEGDLVHQVKEEQVTRTREETRSRCVMTCSSGVQPRTWVDEDEDGLQEGRGMEARPLSSGAAVSGPAFRALQPRAECQGRSAAAHPPAEEGASGSWTLRLPRPSLVPSRSPGRLGPGEARPGGEARAGTVRPSLCRRCWRGVWGGRAEAPALPVSGGCFSSSLHFHLHAALGRMCRLTRLKFKHIWFDSLKAFLFC
ncbi:uncharacterized protein LOC123649951 [Lemur catta]|uniref:uncharacterized protein LOC123649951 n=1 Tax=Lemur catta TaxID=9447 RepID=UPI001E26BD41|nr:uncharacterized protein LOC123649951 [Lemur catta]